MDDGGEVDSPFDRGREVIEQKNARAKISFGSGKTMGFIFCYVNEIFKIERGRLLPSAADIPTIARTSSPPRPAPAESAPSHSPPSRLRD